MLLQQFLLLTGMVWKSIFFGKSFSCSETPVWFLLQAASKRLPTDKVVTQADAQRVKRVESRNDPFGRLQEGGIGETMQAAADFNEAQGFTGNP